jgi:hypothetical protein
LTGFRRSAALESQLSRHVGRAKLVSETGDHYNNIAVFSLVLANTGSGLVVAGILLARGWRGDLLGRPDRGRAARSAMEPQAD